jgi:hypothetical protein
MTTHNTMPTHEQLYLRALRILNDGMAHAPAATRWARHIAGFECFEDIPPDPVSGFTLRELSLGADLHA